MPNLVIIESFIRIRCKLTQNLGHKLANFYEEMFTRSNIVMSLQWILMKPHTVRWTKLFWIDVL